MEKRETSLQGFWNRPLQSLLQQLQATPAGLTTDEAKRQLRFYGPNSMVPESRFAGVLAFLRLSANPLVVILLGASGVSLGLGDDIDGLIIFAIVLLSVLLVNLYFHRPLLESFVFAVALAVGMTRGERNV